MKLIGVALTGALALATLALPSVASATTKYVLKHPKHERCRAHDVKRVVHGKTWCVRLIPTSMAIETTGQSTGVQHYLAVWAAIFPTAAGDFGGNSDKLRDLPVRYTISDRTTGHIFGSFPGLSTGYCGLAWSTNEQDTVITFIGAAYNNGDPVPACALKAPVSLPWSYYLGNEDQRFAISGSFIGNSIYGPSSAITPP